MVWPVRMSASLYRHYCMPCPFVYWHWQGFSTDDVDRPLSILLYNSLATVIGILKDREILVHERLLKEERLIAMGKSLAAVAKTPLVLLGGVARQLLKKFNTNDLDRKKQSFQNPAAQAIHTDGMALVGRV